MAKKKIGHLHAIISADSKPFGRGVDRAQMSLKSFGASTTAMSTQLKSLSRSLIATAGVAGFGAIIASSLRSVDALGKTADKLGLTTSALAKLQFAGEQSGVRIETLNMALQRMVRRVAEASKGTGEAKDAIRELGLDAKTLSGQSPDQIFKAITAAMESVPNQADKIRLAMRLFDSEGVALVNVMNNGVAGIAALEAQAERLGLALDRGAVKKIEEANDAMNAMRATITASIAGAVVELSDEIKELTKWLTGFITASGKAAKIVADIAGPFGLLVAKASILSVGFSALSFAAKTVSGGFVGMYRSVASMAGILATNAAAVAAETAAMHANTAAIATNATVRNGRMRPGKASRPSRFDRLMTPWDRGSPKTTPSVAAWRGLNMGKPGIGDYADISNMSQIAPIKSVDVDKATKGLASFKFASMGIVGTATVAAAAVVGLAVAFQQLYTWATKGAGATIGGGITDKLFGFEDKYYKAGDVTVEQHNLNIEAYKRKQEEAAAAVKRHAEAQVELRKNITSTLEGLRDKFTSALPNADELKSIEEVMQRYADAGTGRGIHSEQRDKDIAEVKEYYKLLAQSGTERGLKDRVSALQGEAKNIGLDQFQQLLRDLQRQYNEAPDSKRGFFGQMIIDAKNAQREIDKFGDRMGALDDVASKYNKLESILNPTGGGSGSIGAYQVGSLESYRQTRSTKGGLLTLENLQKEANSLSKDIRGEMQKHGITLKDIASKTGRSTIHVLP